MQSLQPTPVRHAFPQLRRLHFFSPHNQRLIADYLTHLRVRHYAPSTQEGTLRALKCFAVLMPEARQAILYQDLTQTTPADIDAWIEAAFQQSLAPATIATCRRGMQSFFSNSRFILKILYDLCRQALAERIACPRSRV